MYVFVTVAELTGPEKQVSLGQVEDDVTLQTLLERCLQRIDKLLPEQNRDASRHFWYNDRFVPFTRTYLRDVTASVNVTLELRPDYYQVELPKAPATRYAIDPELTTAQAIDALMNASGAWRRYNLLTQDGRPLQRDESLFRQQMLPYQSDLWKGPKLIVCRKRQEGLMRVLLLVAGCMLMGLLVYLFPQAALMVGSALRPDKSVTDLGTEWLYLFKTQWLPPLMQIATLILGMASMAFVNHIRKRFGHTGQNDEQILN